MDLNKKIVYNYVDNFVDFPNRYAITLFFSGCNLHCPFCYNKHVVQDNANFSLNEVLQKKIEIENCFSNLRIGVVFSGGEPTVQKDFKDIINIFIDNPLSIHTNGIIIPDFDNCFESVVLSLKTRECGVPENYLDKMKNALYYYKDCKQKEINIVKIDKYLDEYGSYMNEIGDLAENLGYKIKFSKNIQEAV